MSIKLVTLVIAFVAIGSTLLVWRHQRNELANSLAELSRRYYNAQQSIDRVKASAAEMNSLPQLRKRIEQAQLVLEPAVPQLQPGQPSHLAARSNDSNE